MDAAALDRNCLLRSSICIVRFGIFNNNNKCPLVLLVQSSAVSLVLHPHFLIENTIRDRRRVLPSVVQTLLIFFLCIHLDIEVGVVDDIGREPEIVFRSRLMSRNI